MKVTLDIRMAGRRGGAGVYTAELARALVEHYPAVEWGVVMNMEDERQGGLVEELEERARIEKTVVWSGCLGLRQHREFGGVKVEGDVYHYPHFDVPLGLRARGLVMTVHDLYPLEVAGYCGWLKRWYFKELTRKNVRRAAKVIAVSAYTKEQLGKRLGLGEEKIRVVHQGYNKAYRRLEDEQLVAAVRERYRLGERFILYSGNHKRHKNLMRLVEAYARLEPELRKAYGLVFTGEAGADSEEVRAVAQRLGVEGRLIFAGYVREEDLPGLYNAASMLVQPSLTEGFGMPPIEAMACGTPVAAARGGALPEVVGEAGRLFDPYDVEEMAEVLRKVLREDVGNDKVRQKVQAWAERFGWEKTARETFKVFEEAAKTGG